jgi:hypothetical protein
MRHRITYLRQPKAGEDFDPRESLKVWEKSMRISDLDAAKEHKITLSLEELPQEVRSIFVLFGVVLHDYGAVRDCRDNEYDVKMCK